MSNKIKNFSKKQPPKFEVENPENISAEDMEYLNGTPSRMEVANYVNSLLEQEYMPMLQSAINGVSQGAKLGVMIMQAILIEKGVVTGEEIEKLTKEFMERFAREQKEIMHKAKDDKNTEKSDDEEKPEEKSDDNSTDEASDNSDNS